MSFILTNFLLVLGPVEVSTDIEGLDSIIDPNNSARNTGLWTANSAPTTRKSFELPFVPTRQIVSESWLFSCKCFIPFLTSSNSAILWRATLQACARVGVYQSGRCRMSFCEKDLFGNVKSYGAKGGLLPKRVGKYTKRLGISAWKKRYPKRDFYLNLRWWYTKRSFLPERLDPLVAKGYKMYPPPQKDPFAPV